jgi:hypothetical protein
MKRAIGTAFLICISGGCGESGTPTGVSVVVGSAQIAVAVDWLGCRSAPMDTRVTFDGVLVPLVSSGGQGQLLGGGSRCEAASFVLATETTFSDERPQSTVEISTGETSAQATFTSLIAPRSLMLVGGDTVTAGAAATFQLTPSTDTILVVEKMRWDTATGLVPVRGATFVGSIITASVPVDVVSGDTLTLSWGRGTGLTSARVDQCAGLALCLGQPLVVPTGAVVHVQ